jgi:hypothetical protein
MVFPIERETNHWNTEDGRAYQAGLLMVAPEVQGIDLFKIAGRSISGWVPSYKTSTVIRQPFCSQLEERLLLWLEYHPLVASYARGDIGPEFATKYRLPIPQHAPFAIGYTFENNPHHYLPDVVGTLADGTPFIAEAGMEDDKRGDRNLVKAEAARRLASLQQGTFWKGNRNHRQTSLLQAGAYSRAALEAGPGLDGDARRRQIGGASP